MSLQALPVELLLSVSQQLESNSLAALARTCSSLCPVARRVLYRHVSVSVWSRNLSVVILLAKNPDIALYVRSFHIAIDSLSPIFRTFYCMLAKAILNMTELHSLNLLIDSTVSWVLKEACDRTSYPHLLHFTCTFPFDVNVVNFLGKATSLIELEVDSIPTMLTRHSPIPSLPESSIPHLEQFIGSSRAARLIVPGRPVKSIHINGSSLTEDDVPLLARSSASVVVLGAATNALPVPFLELLHRHLPHLAYLRVMSMQNMFKAPTAEFYEQVANVLTSFSELNAFELSGMHWGSQQKRDDGSKRIWQSSPLSSRTHPDDELSFGTEIFLAY
ncbi:hypothetical protein BDN67DRAFT_961321 [Paxillus ammoniavirescens]|nr:hypothetical protein BDN67DRAFT_961321 [Paxillus ammoniavirescens]